MFNCQGPVLRGRPWCWGWGGPSSRCTSPPAPSSSPCRWKDTYLASSVLERNSLGSTQLYPMIWATSTQDRCNTMQCNGCIISCERISQHHDRLSGTVLVDGNNLLPSLVSRIIALSGFNSDYHRMKNLACITEHRFLHHLVLKLGILRTT